MAFFRTFKAMKLQLTKILLVVSALAFTIQAGAAERWETLRAINWVENPTNQTKVGRFGELGPYQFRPATWRMHTNKPFQLAIQRAEADEIAVKHYEWIKRTFERAGVEASAFNIAMAWNCGVEAVLSGRVPSVSYNYAQRVTNLMESFNAERAEVAEQESGPKNGWQEQNASIGDNGGIRFRVLLDTPRFVIAG